jgi:flagellar export protein FliJ
MPFRFSLDAVLTYRQTIEQRESLALDRIVYEMANLKRQLREAEESSATQIRGRDSELAAGVQSASLRDTYEQLRALERLRESIAKRLQELEGKREKQQKVYELARQKREILDQLRTERRNLYMRQQTKKQQAMLDDLFLAKHIRRR